MPYDAVKDFRAIARIGYVDFVLCVHPSLPVKSLRDFIAFAKKKQGEINYASPGSGTPGHLAMELLKPMSGIRLVHIPYKGAAQALTDVLGGQVVASFIVGPAAIPQIKGGRLRALAISSAKRSPQLPDVPSAEESGYVGFDIVAWIGFAGPAGLSNEVVTKISGDVLAAINLPDVRERILAAGVEPAPAGSDEFGIYIAKERAKWTKLVKDSGAKLD